MSTAPRTSTDVLVVGAGPTGTALAIDLIRRGVDVRVIDKEPHAFEGSRAKGVQPRTLEVFDDLGVIADILDQGSVYPKMGIHIGPLTIPWRMIAVGKRGADTPYPDTWLIPQNRTTHILHERLRALGGDVELGTEFSGLSIAPGGVTAELVTDSGPEMATARYVVGADGGSSRVRKAAGIDFGGSTDEADRMLVIDAAVTGGLSRTYWHVWPGIGGRFVGACPLPHSELFQWMIRLAPGEEPPVDEDAITAHVRERTRNNNLRLHSIAWKSLFRPNIRLAEIYRRGPVILAGDAAHVHTPAGAQGLNTGIGDAYNLGWKLGQVLAGADERLLDTYEGERQPIAAGVLGLSTKKYEGLSTLDPSSIRRGKDEKQLTLTYRGGPVAPATSDATATLHVGDRAPDAELCTTNGDPIRLFDIFRGPHFTAIAHGTEAAVAAGRLDWPRRGAHLRRIVIGTATTGAADTLRDTAGGFGRSYGLTTDTLLLIRPDGYIGHIATHDLLDSTQRVIAALTP